MPEYRQKLPLSRRFSAADVALIRKGLIPASMDDKWFIYFDPTTGELRMHRSWTGYCIYLLKVGKKGDGYEISEAWVNRDPKQYESEDIDHDAEVASWLIDVFLLGRCREFPSQ